MQVLYCPTVVSGALRSSEPTFCAVQVVAAREVLYLATTLAGVLVCPAYLLLDLATVWTEDGGATTAAKVFRAAVYVLTPHNYVAVCLAAALSDRGASPCCAPLATAASPWPACTMYSGEHSAGARTLNVRAQAARGRRRTRAR